jgi:hypothetical protein
MHWQLFEDFLAFASSAVATALTEPAITATAVPVQSCQRQNQPNLLFCLPACHRQY